MAQGRRRLPTSACRRLSCRLAGEELAANRFVLTPVNPVEQLCRQIEAARPGLQRLLPDREAWLPALHEVVQDAAAALRTMPTAFGHGDINMGNILITTVRVVLIDWESPRVADPTLEVPLLDTHASLFNGCGLPAPFVTGYGQQPNTSIHRVVQALVWASSSDWDEYEADPDLSAEMKQRTRGWLSVLVEYLHDLPQHVNRLRALTSSAR